MLEVKEPSLTADMQQGKAAMELADYLRAIWRFKLIVFVILVITVGIAAGVTLYLPKTYISNVTLRAPNTPSIFIPGYVPNPSDRENQFNVYQEMVSNAYFRQEVLNRAVKKSDLRAVGNLGTDDFSIASQGLPKANLFILSVEGPSGRVSQALANAAAEALVHESMSSGVQSARQITDAVKQEIEPVDNELVRLRKEVAYLQAQPKPGSEVSRFKKAAEIAHFRDQIEETLSLRHVYTDLLHRISMNNLLQQDSLQLIYPAALPTRAASPSLPQNLVIAFAVGLLLGITAAIALAYGQRAESSRKIGKD